MEKKIQKIVGFISAKSPHFDTKETSSFIYKKLPLVGYTDEDCKDKFFESISEAEFNCVLDKKLECINSLELHKFKGTYDLAGIDVQTKAGEVYRHHG